MPNIIVVNLHGLINVPMGTRRALEELCIDKGFSATVVTDDSTTMGTLKLCKDYVAWSPVDGELLTSLLKQRAKVSMRKRLDQGSLKSLGYKSYEDLASKIIKEGMRFSSLKKMRPYFALSPPRGGFRRSSRRQYREGGILGENPELPSIIKRMI
jgi:large subunit ribosomal protein L30